MKNEIYKDDFENFLKENANDFVMVPSRRVWYSLYNNMHPDRKWPSVAVCLLILSGVLYLGISENYTLSNAARRAAAENLSGLAANYTNNKPSRFFLPVPAVKDATSHRYRSENSPLTAEDITSLTNAEYASNTTAPPATDEQFTASATTTDSRTLPGNTLTIPVTTAITNRNTTAPITPQRKNEITDGNLTASNTDLVPETEAENNENSVSVNPIIPVTNNVEVLKAVTDMDKPWREDFAFRNKPAINKFKQNTGISYYITPSFGYRGFFLTGKKTNSFATADLHDGAALNLEAGAALIYGLSPRLRLKGGLQANYTNYVSKVTELIHPTQATLAVENETTAARSSVYAVKAGYARLNKTTFQVALPLGADIKLAGRNRIKWYVGGTLQPTYVISGSAYVLSKDGNHYITETPLLRKWNMNAAVETFVSFRPGAGITLNVGPQFRGQLLSTYKKEYNYTEKLYNIGLKLGITTGL